MVTRYTLSCDCGGTAVSGRCLHLSHEDGQDFEIDLDFISQTDLRCPDCGRIYYIGDLDIECDDSEMFEDNGDDE